LAGGPQQDLVQSHPSWSGDCECDHVGDVRDGDGQLGVELLGGLLGVRVGDVIGQLGVDRAGFDQVTRMSGCSSCRSASDQPFMPTAGWWRSTCSARGPAPWRLVAGPVMHLVMQHRVA
jgi:hypothetical protein